MDAGRELDVGGRDADTSSTMHSLPPQARVMMGPEEVVIRGGDVSVNGQLVPDGESRLLPGKGQSARPQGGAQKGSREQPATDPHCSWEAFGNVGAS